MLTSASEHIRSLFENKYVQDEREPVRTFEIPGVDGAFGLYRPVTGPWMQVALIVLMMQAVQCFFAVIIYKTIIAYRGTPGAYLIGWGIIMPLALWLPFEFVEYLDVRNGCLKMAFGQLPMVVFFRTIEAMYDTSPPVVEATLTNYVLYYSALIHHVWDKSTQQRVKVNTQQFISGVLRCLYYYNLLCVSLSVMMHFSFKPFASPVVMHDYHLTWDILRPAHLANSYLLALHTYLHLLSGFEITNLGENVKGYLTKPTFINPLFESTSPTDFWSRRWNLMIGNVLKGGTFLPARKYFGTKVAVFMTFLMSGLMHDYIWMVIFYHHLDTRDSESGTCADCFHTKPFKLTAFFAWNGFIMLLERPLSKVPPFRWMTPQYLPLPLVSTFVLLTALPVTHWFTGDWAVGRYFADFAMALWHIRKID